MTDLRKFIFVDTETTGLDPTADELVECSFALEDGPIKTLYFGVVEVPDFIDNLIGFTERGIAGWESSPEEVQEFLDVSEKQTMVAANPGFDRGFLEAAGLYKFGYRMLDIETYAMAVLDLPYVPSMRDVFEELAKRGHAITEPKHTSASDVAATREAFYILRELQADQVNCYIQANESA